jgi:hypothetical protein
MQVRTFILLTLTLFLAGCALANLFNIFPKVTWPESMSELKSNTTIFSHNLFVLFGLQQFLEILTGQQ